MPPVSTWIVKLGGSLLGSAALPAWLAACAAPAATRCVVVAGGGGLADEVARLQSRWQFDDELAHALAIAAMGMNARVLHALEPRLRLGTGAEVDALVPTGSLLWIPDAETARQVRPATWAVGADAIALWLAQRLEAAALVLVKSLPAHALAAFGPVAPAATLAAAGVVDADVPVRLGRQPLPVFVHGGDASAAFLAARLAGIPGGLPVVASGDT